jgi:thiamine biosynthesis lipoprotein
MTALAIERAETFACFGGQCTVIAADAADPGTAVAAITGAKARLLAWHEQFSRFEPDSELSRLNIDPWPVVPVSPLMGRILAASRLAAERTGGLVDATLGGEIERVGYDQHFAGNGLDLERLLQIAPPRAPARPHPEGGWQRIHVDRRSGTVSRPLGTVLDPGGIAKGVFADELAALFARYDAFVVDCGGDMRLGGRLGLVREVHVASPFDDSILHTMAMSSGGVATSGIGRRSWLDSDGRPAHHLLDPATGRPAFTGIVQVTALAPTATEAEALSKAALLSGPERAEQVLVHGGAIVLEDGNFIVLERDRGRALAG